MKQLVYILVLIFLFSCRQTEKQNVETVKKASEIKKEVDENTKKIFLKKIEQFEPKKPFRVPFKIRLDSHMKNPLTDEQVNDLQLEKVFLNTTNKSTFGVLKDIKFSENFKTFLIYQHDENLQTIYNLINYSNDYKLLDNFEVSNYNYKKKICPTIRTNVFDDKFFVHDNEKDSLKEFYKLTDKGKFVKQLLPAKFNYLKLKDYKFLYQFLSGFSKRVVKAKSGLIIRDSVGNKIGKYDYLETVTVIGYSKDKIKINDNGKIIVGQKLKVIINPDKLKKEDNFFIRDSNIGYVFSGFLFDNWSEGENYRTEWLSIAGSNAASFSLKELFEIKQVNLDKYLSRVIKTPEIKDVTDTYKKDKLVTLIAKNGKQLKFRDTTYNSEYSPTKTHYVRQDSNFQDTYIVGSDMIFSHQDYSFISKETGEFLDTYYGGYLHVSPDKTYVVSVDYDGECPNQRTLFIDRIVDNRIVETLKVYYDLEGYSELDFIKAKDINEIYWLSNTEFIINFWGAIDCYDNSEEYFYYKYKIKEPLLDLLEFNGSNLFKVSYKSKSTLVEFNFINNHPLEVNFNYPEVSKSISKDTLIFKTESFDFKLIKSKFDANNYKIKKDKGGYVEYLNGKTPFGIDGNPPKNIIQAISVNNKKGLKEVNKRNFEDLFEPNFESSKLYITDFNQLLLTMWNGNGAGGYYLILLIDETGNIQRTISIP